MTSVMPMLVGAMGGSVSPNRRSSAPQQAQQSAQRSTLQRPVANTSTRTKPVASNARPLASPSPRAPQSSSNSPPAQTAQAKTSPNSASKLGRESIKTEEPASPVLHNARPRPRRLDLSNGGVIPRAPYTAGNLGAKDSGGLAVKDLGVACLSPGFQTQDPGMREQLQRSLTVMEQQRQLIAARQGGSSGKFQEGSRPSRGPDGPSLAGPPSSEEGSLAARRKGPPAGLSISAPAPAAFANERVIQSAPLNASFTGLRRGTHIGQPSSLGQTSHMRPPTQQTNRLPPLSDVFANERLDPPQSASFRPSYHAPPSGPMRSPGFLQQQQQQQQSQPHSGGQLTASQAREFRNAEEAVQGISGGREELLPKLVHYGSAQPPTPPSPRHAQQAHTSHYHGQQSQAQRNEPRPEPPHSASGIGRRRPRDEYERENGGTPPTRHPSFKRHAREEDDWRTEMGSREKREEFLRLCERAWDLFHS